MNGGGAVAGAAGAVEGGGGGEGGAQQAVFRKVTVGESSLWETKRIQPDLNRVRLRTTETVLDPTVSADHIIGAVAYAVTSHGLRVTQREYGRIVAQRVEAPYLASVSSGSWRSGGGQEREEWRMLEASLGVSRGVGEGKAVERVLSLSFMTDPVPKPTDLAGKGAAAMSSLMDSVGSVAATFSSSITSASNGGPGSGAGGTSGSAVGAAGAGAEAASASSMTAVEIANLRSNQRADSLVQAIVAELGSVGFGGGTGRRRSGSATTAVAAAPVSRGPSLEQGATENEAAAGVDDEAPESAAAAAIQEEEMVLAPFDGSNGCNAGAPGAGAASLTALAAGEEGEGPGDAQARRRSARRGAQGAEDYGDGVGTAGATARGCDSGTAVVEVRLCLQFVEGICARAEEYSRHDAAETWKPLQETVLRLERNNATLRSLLEPQYRAAGAAPPPVPSWSGRRAFGETDGSWLGSAALNAGNVPSRRVVALLEPTPLFAIEGKWVKARVVAAAVGKAKHNDGDGGGSGEGEADRGDSVGSSAPACAAAPATNPAAPPRRSRRHASSVQAAVKTLADVVGRACEAREEAFLKARLPGAQAYTVELERYRSAIVGGSALRGVSSAPRDGGQGNASSVEVDDDLWRLFGAQETRLYSSSAALGKKPGRIYVTYNTLWFHSKVLGFESRLVLPLAEVRAITLLAAALDLSSSIVIATESNGAKGELMLVFPGRKRRQVEPLEVLLRELAIMAAKEKSAAAVAAAAAATEGSAATILPGISI
ncbi:unnamed protein product [Scytosiphon promiscuus]